MEHCPTCTRPYRWIGDYSKIQLLKVHLVTPTAAKGEQFSDIDYPVEAESRDFVAEKRQDILREVREKLELHLKDSGFIKSDGVIDHYYVSGQYTRDEKSLNVVYDIKIKKTRDGRVTLSLNEIYVDETEQVMGDLRSESTQKYLQGLRSLEGKVVPVRRILPKWPNIRLVSEEFDFGHIIFDVKYRTKYDNHIPNKIRPTLVFGELRRHKSHDQQDISLEYLVKRWHDGPNEHDVAKIAQLDFVGREK